MTSLQSFSDLVNSLTMTDFCASSLNALLYRALLADFSSSKGFSEVCFQTISSLFCQSSLSGIESQKSQTVLTLSWKYEICREVFTPQTKEEVRVRNWQSLTIQLRNYCRDHIEPVQCAEKKSKAGLPANRKFLAKRFQKGNLPSCFGDNDSVIAFTFPKYENVSPTLQ